MSAPPFRHSDGGRARAGYKGEAGDCAVRAIAIATGVPYARVYSRLNAIAVGERPKRNGKRSNARTGVWRSTVDRFMADLGWVWVPTMKVGQGCTVHVRAEELPHDRLVLRLSGHFAAFVYGTLEDTHDCSRGGERCVYGYWRPPTNFVPFGKHWQLLRRAGRGHVNERSELMIARAYINHVRQRMQDLYAEMPEGRTLVGKERARRASQDQAAWCLQLAAARLRRLAEHDAQPDPPVVGDSR